MDAEWEMASDRAVAEEAPPVNIQYIMRVQLHSSSSDDNEIETSVDYNDNDAGAAEAVVGFHISEKQCHHSPVVLEALEADKVIRLRDERRRREDPDELINNNEGGKKPRLVPLTFSLTPPERFPSYCVPYLERFFKVQYQDPKKKKNDIEGNQQEREEEEEAEGDGPSSSTHQQKMQDPFKEMTSRGFITSEDIAEACGPELHELIWCDILGQRTFSSSVTRASAIAPSSFELPLSVSFHERHAAVTAADFQPLSTPPPPFPTTATTAQQPSHPLALFNALVASLRELRMHPILDRMFAHLALHFRHKSTLEVMALQDPSNMQLGEAAVDATMRRLSKRPMTDAGVDAADEEQLAAMPKIELVVATSARGNAADDDA